MKKLLGCLVVLALLSAGASAAFAQAACPIDRGSPVVSSATTYTVSNNDNCKMLVFTSASGVAVTLPNPATTLPPGWNVWLKVQGTGTLVATPSGFTIDGSASVMSLTTGQGVGLRTDGINYYSSGQGIARP